MDDDRNQPSSPSQRARRFVASAIVVAAALLTVLVAGANDSAQAEESEVCTSTVYEGCPGRWEAEWATPAG